MSALPNRARTTNALAAPKYDREDSDPPYFKPSDEESEEYETDTDGSLNEAVYYHLRFKLRPNFGFIGKFRPTDNVETRTSIDQSEVEQRLKFIIDDWIDGEQRVFETKQEEIDPKKLTNLHTVIAVKRQIHASYLMRNIELLPGSYASLDSSRPWLVYWVLNSMTLLHQSNNPSNPQSIVGAIPISLCERCIDFLSRCQSPSGGFCGSPPPPVSNNQSINRSVAHLAPTYAAVLSLSIIAAAQPSLAQRAFQIIDRPNLASFLLAMKQPDGSFSVTEDGECDTRGAYTALVSASLTGLLDDSSNEPNSLRSRLIANTASWLASCQTYEGGIGGEPGNEAHGGYSFCGLAASLLVSGSHLLNLENFIEWTCHRQHPLEGGLSGRTNKLVDGCYSFWVAALEPLIQYAMGQQSSASSQQSSNQAINQSSKPSSSLLDNRALQRYILLACQANTGGLRDKPGKNPDLYHSCYCLSGLSIAQEATTASPDRPIVGLTQSRVQPTNPIYNIHPTAVDAAIAYFNTRPLQQ